MPNREVIADPFLIGTQVDYCASARRVVTRKPRATPWVANQGNHQALKGRNNHRGMCRPFRADRFLNPRSQGCALGFRVSALRAKSANINLSPNNRTPQARAIRAAQNARACGVRLNERMSH